MSTNRLLPITVPDIVSYAHLTYFLSILHNDPDAMKWVYSNFIQLVMTPTDAFIDYYTPSPEHNVVPVLHGSQRINRQTVLHFTPDINSFIRHQINNGYYFWSYVNDFYIPGTLSYENRSYTHALMVHGYDDENRVFHISGFFEKQRYGIRTISYELMEKAYKETVIDPYEPAQDLVYLIRTHELRKTQTDFRLQWVMYQLDEFLHSSVSTDRMGAMELREGVPRRIYGMQIYDELQRQIRLELQTENRQMIDHRPYYVLWEHKKVMNRRLAYMNDNGHFQFSDSVLEGYKEVEAIAFTIRNMKIKYLMTFDDKYLNQIDTRLDQLKSLEKSVITNMQEQFLRGDTKNESKPLLNPISI